MIASNAFRVWLAATAAIWIVVFAWPARTPQASALVHPRERWSLPALPEQRDLTPSAQAVANSPLWGALPGSAAAGAAGPAAEPAEDTRWVLAGIYARDGDPRVVVRFMAKRDELQLAVGDKLPSGEKIVEIGSDAIWVAQKHGRRRMPLYGIGPEQP
jgi:hypothetical protein